MAKPVLMKNPQNGLLKKGYYGYSWTYLFWGWFVPLFRGELGVAALHLLFSLMTLGVWQIIVSFMYNKQHLSRLITDGFKFADRAEINMQAAAAAGADIGIAALNPGQ